MERLRERTVFADQRRTVNVLEKLELRTSKTKRSRFTTGILKPIKVVVKELDRTYTFDLDSSVTD